MKRSSKLTMQQYIENHPYLAETINLRAGIENILAERVEKVTLIDINAVKDLVKDGKPLLQQKKPQELVVKSAALWLSEVVEPLKKLAMPEPMKDALTALADKAKELSVAEKETAFRLLLTQQDEKLAELLGKLQLNETLFRTIGWAIIDALIPDELKNSDLWESVHWARNYCPVCGRPPVIAQLRKEKQGRARFFSCDGCHTAWQHKRVGCVYCGNDDLKEMHILEIEGEPSMRLDVCDKCHTYLKTYDGEGLENIYLKDYATLHLDLLAEREELTKKGSVLMPFK